MEISKITRNVHAEIGNESIPIIRVTTLEGLESLEDLSDQIIEATFAASMEYANLPHSLRQWEAQVESEAAKVFQKDNVKTYS